MFCQQPAMVRLPFSEARERPGEEQERELVRLAQWLEVVVNPSSSFILPLEGFVGIFLFCGNSIQLICFG